MEPGRAIFPLRALIRLGGTLTALLRLHLMVFGGRRMLRLDLLGGPLMFLRDGVVLLGLPSFLRGPVLTGASLFISGHGEPLSALTLARGLLALFACRHRMRLGFLSMPSCLPAKPLALAATVLRRATAPCNHDAEHYQDANNDED